MNPQCILIHYHEIGLKGDNRSWFEKIFIKNIKIQLNKLPYKKIQIIAARIIVFGVDSNIYKQYHKNLSKVMGLKHAFLMSITELNEKSMNIEIQSQIKKINFIYYLSIFKRKFCIKRN